MDVDANPISCLRGFAEELTGEHRTELFRIADAIQLELERERAARLPLAFDSTAPREVRIAELEIELCALRNAMPDDSVEKDGE